MDTPQDYPVPVLSIVILAKILFDQSSMKVANMVTAAIPPLLPQLSPDERLIDICYMKLYKGDRSSILSPPPPPPSLMRYTVQDLSNTLMQLTMEYLSLTDH